MSHLAYVPHARACSGSLDCPACLPSLAALVVCFILAAGCGPDSIEQSVADTQRDASAPVAPETTPDETERPADEAPSKVKEPLRYPAGNVTSTNADGIITILRPFLSKLRPEDPKCFALHWATPFGPGDWDYWHVPVDWERSLQSIQVAVTSPTGQRRILRLGPKPARDESSPDEALLMEHFGPKPELRFDPTIVFTLPENGQELEPDEFRWVDANGFSASAVGIYCLSVWGVLHRANGHPPLLFATGEVQFEVTNDCLTFAETLSASDDLREHVKGNSIIEDVDGNRVVAYPSGRDVGQWRSEEIRVVIRPDGTVKATHRRTSELCLAAGTSLATEQGPRAVEVVAVGERVWGYDLAEQRNVLTHVVAVRRKRAASTLRFPCGLRVTEEHPLFASGQWKLARDVRPTDSFLHLDGQESPCGVAERIGQPIDVFDITVDAPHNFFARGVLVHNKDRLYWPLLDDPWYRIWPTPERPQDPKQARAVEVIKAAGGRIQFGHGDPPGRLLTIEFFGDSHALGGPTDEDLLVLNDLPRVKSIQFRGCRRIDGNAIHILGGLDDLEELGFSDCSVDDDTLRALAGFPNLRRLSLGFLPVTGNGIGQLARFPQLRELVLREVLVGDEGLAHLSALPQLQVLQLGGRQLSDLDFAMRQLDEHPRIHEPFTDAGLVHVGKFKNLRSLDLSRTSVTGTGLQHLKGMENLSHLRVRRDVPDSLRDELQAALPDLHIE